MLSGKAAQLNLTKGPSAAGAVVMDGVGDQFLADAAFAEDQHRRLGGGHLVDQPVDFLHRLGIADDVGRLESLLERILQPAVLVLQPSLVEILQQIQLDRRRDHRGDRRQQLDVLFQESRLS